MSQLSVLATIGRRPATLALLGLAALALSACAGKDRPRADLAASQVTTIGVNSYLWRASLDALSFMPLLQADRSEEHTSELQSLMRISYAVFCLKKNTNKQTYRHKQNN